MSICLRDSFNRVERSLRRSFVIRSSVRIFKLHYFNARYTVLFPSPFLRHYERSKLSEKFIANAPNFLLLNRFTVTVLQGQMNLVFVHNITRLGELDLRHSSLATREPLIHHTPKSHYRFSLFVKEVFEKPRFVE